jgi:hypothetical protein
MLLVDTLPWYCYLIIVSYSGINIVDDGINIRSRP